MIFKEVFQISLHVHSGLDAELRYERIQNCRGDECGKVWSQVNVLNPEMEQAEQYRDCFLLVPGNGVGDGKFVDISLEGL